MKRLSFAVAASFLLIPVSTLAAYSTPAELMAAVQGKSVPRSFTVTAHAMNDDTFVTVWASGAEQGTDPQTIQMTTKATVDVVKGKLRIRAKAELLATGGMLYARLVSFDGSYQSAFASIAGVVKQQKWVSMPLDEAMLDQITGGSAMNVSSADPAQADNMFHMQSKPGKNGGTVYTLTLTQDYASTLAQLIRQMLNDQSTANDDFFPWRQLAEGMRFESTVMTDAHDAFVSSVFSLSTASSASSLSISGSEQKLAAALSVKAPSNAITMDQALATFNDLQPGVPASGMAPMMPQPVDSGSMMMNGGTSNATSDSADKADTMTTSSASTDCSAPSITPLQLSMLQRTGSCPVEKRSTRYGGW